MSAIFRGLTQLDTRILQGSRNAPSRQQSCQQYAFSLVTSFLSREGVLYFFVVVCEFKETSFSFRNRFCC